MDGHWVRKKGAYSSTLKERGDTLERSREVPRKDPSKGNRKTVGRLNSGGQFFRSRKKKEPT